MELKYQCGLVGAHNLQKVPNFGTLVNLGSQLNSKVIGKNESRYSSLDGVRI